MNNEPILIVENLHKKYLMEKTEIHVLKGLNLTIKHTWVFSVKKN